MLEAGVVISYEEMCRQEGKRLQKGMNFQRGRPNAVFLMSRRPNAPYSDMVEEDGAVLIYQGHDARPAPGIEPKLVDQPLTNPDGSPTDNGKFFEVAQAAKRGETARRVHVYEKIQTSIWTFNGAFALVDAWVEKAAGRQVCKFKLRLVANQDASPHPRLEENPRVIPGEVKAAVWKRDGGKCARCGRADNLHFDHIIPYSKGGTSLTVENIQVLCARHNLSKGARIA